MPNRYRLKGASLEEIRQKAERQYGPAARIVSAERVISPGIAGLFAQDRYEAMVEVLPKHEVVTGEVVPDADILAGPEAAPSALSLVPLSLVPPGRTTPGRPPRGRSPAVQETCGGSEKLQRREDTPAAAPVPPSVPTAGAPADRPAVGPSHQLHGAAIAALLEEADAAELSLHRPATAGVSTESRDFAELLEQLGAGLRTPAEPAAVPAQPAAAVGPASAAGTAAPSGPLSPAEPAAGSAGAGGAALAAPPAAVAPAPLTGVGDLVALVGLGEDAMDAALAMSMAAGGADVRTAGDALRLWPPARRRTSKRHGSTRPRGDDGAHRHSGVRTRQSPERPGTGAVSGRALCRPGLGSGRCRTQA